MSNGKKYKFSGHQTFVFRHGWLEKGVRAVEKRPAIFSQDDALVLLGVGKNMVESIKHWCLVTQLIEEHRDDGSTAYRITDIGRKLLLEWDPFLEDDASLWLVHWLLSRLIRKSARPGSLCSASSFDLISPRRKWSSMCLAFAAKHELKVQESSVSRDVDCFIRTYCPSNGSSKQTLSEETFDCPLLALDLVQLYPDGEIFRFAIGPKPSLPADVVAFALGQYFDRTQKSSNTLSVQECLYGTNSPGQVFKLDENSLLQYIEEIATLTRKDVLLDETAGLKQIYRNRPFDACRILAALREGGAKMTAERTSLADCIEIGGRFLRSVNLEKDFSADIQNGEYVVTPTARQILHQLAEGLNGRSTSRSWTITGPYGVGKSAFGVFLTRLLCSEGQPGATAVRKLKEVDPVRGREFERIRQQRHGQKLMFPILVTARQNTSERLSARSDR